MKKYEVITDGGKAIIRSQEGYFAGYDFMGSVDWTDSIDSAYQCETREAGDIIRDLEAADEPCEPKKNVIHIDELMDGLKDFLEAIGCTDVKVSNLDEKKLSDLYKNAVEI